MKQKKRKKSWTTPTLEELPVTMEIAAYRCAKLDSDGQ